MDIIYKCVYHAKAQNTKRTIEILYSDNPKLKKPWCVQHCGGGHYFRDLYGTLCYAYGRGFINESQIAPIETEVARYINDLKCKKTAPEAFFRAKQVQGDVTKP